MRAVQDVGAEGEAEETRWAVNASQRRARKMRKAEAAVRRLLGRLDKELHLVSELRDLRGEAVRGEQKQTTVAQFLASVLGTRRHRFVSCVGRIFRMTPEIKKRQAA